MTRAGELQSPLVIKPVIKLVFARSDQSIG